MNTGKTKKKWRKRLSRLIALVVILALVAGSFYLFVLPGIKASATTTYNSHQTIIGTISNSMSFSGSVSVQNSEMFTAPSAATVRQVFVSEEQDVQQGDRLMRLSTGETLKASFDGRVNEISVEKGDSVVAGANLIQIVDFNNLRVSLRVDEYDISSIYVGQACTVNITALDLTFESKLTHINRIPASSGSTAYYTVTAEVAVTDGVLPGMQTTVTIPEEEAVDAVILNKDALSFDMRNSAYVLQQNEAGEMEAVYVEIGVDNDNYVEIVSGLSAEDTVYVIAENTASTTGALGILSGIFGGRSNGMPSGEPSSEFNMNFEGGSIDREQMESFRRGNMGGGNIDSAGGMPGGQ